MARWLRRRLGREARDLKLDARLLDPQTLALGL